MKRPGLRAEIVLAFVVVTAFAIGINTVVVWALARMLVVQERTTVAHDAAEAAARLAVASDSVEGALQTARGVPAVVQVVVFDSQGAILGRVGDDLGDRPEQDPTVRRALLDRTEESRVRRGSISGGRVEATTAAPWSDPVRTADGRVTGAVRVVAQVGGDVAAARRFRRLSTFYVALNALMAALIGMWLVSRNLVRPIRSLADATAQISQGVLSVKVPVGGAGEVADLGRSFNRMTQALAERETKIAQQIRDLRAANESLQQAQEEVLQSEKLAGVGRLAAGVAHEMGNPLGAIVGYVSMLLNARDDEDSEDTQTLRRIEREAQRLDRIIRDLLDYARPSEEKSQPLQINDVVETATSIVAAQKDLREVSVTTDLADDLPLVAVDGHRLQQVVVNLMLNAADAVGGRGSIRIRTSRGQFPDAKAMRRKEDPSWRPGAEAIEVRVTDDGPGIPRELHRNLFDPFFTTKEPGKGTGLGLAICRRIIDAASGRIVVETSNESGTTFLIQLPVADA